MSKEPYKKHAMFRPEDLRIVAPAPPPDSPPLRIGDWCRLNCGGPKMMVVDEWTDKVTVAVPGKSVIEHVMDRAVVRRVEVDA